MSGNDAYAVYLAWGLYVLDVDVHTVERLAASSEPLPELVEDRVVWGFDA